MLPRIGLASRSLLAACFAGGALFGAPHAGAQEASAVTTSAVTTSAVTTSAVDAPTPTTDAVPAGDPSPPEEPSAPAPQEELPVSEPPLHEEPPASAPPDDEPFEPTSPDDDPFAPDPHAQEADAGPTARPLRTAGSLNLGAGFRYGVAVGDPLVDPWKSGIGLNLGYTTEAALYVGGVFDYFFGETKEVFGRQLRANVWQFAVEVGYDVQFGEGLLLRPKLGGGASTLNAKCGAACVNDGSKTYVGVGPGVTAMFFFGRVTLSIDGRYQMVFSEPDPLNALIVSAGISF